jgi:predicted metal-binding protein
VNTAGKNKLTKWGGCMELINKLQNELNTFDQTLYSVPIAPKVLEFEERVRLLCFHCMRYSTKWTCPPRIPDIDYKSILTQEYKNGLVVHCRMPFTNEDFAAIRSKSTNQVHKALLHLERVLLNNNIPMAISFIGGSCKLCKNECSLDKCRNPYDARIPLEALGVNVVSSLAKVGIHIEFPVVDTICRYGLLLW